MVNTIYTIAGLIACAVAVAVLFAIIISFFL